NVASLQPSTSFARAAIPFLASSPDTTDDSQTRAAAIFGAPLDLTESFRAGAHGGPAAVRYMSDVLESYSPVLDRDLEALSVVDLGDLRLASGGIEAALETIAQAMEHAATRASLGVML